MNNWDKKFLDVAILVSSWSKDPSTRVGCVIADDDHNMLASGYNGFPRGIADDDRLHDRETKYRLIAHAEANAVASAARNGRALKGGTAYITLPPCSQCAALLIQAGVRQVVFLKSVNMDRWAADWATARGLLYEAGVQFEAVEGQNFSPSGIQFNNGVYLIEEDTRIDAASFDKLPGDVTPVMPWSYIPTVVTPLTARSNPYEFLDTKFLELMNDIGRYGHEKYGVNSFHARAWLGDKSRGGLKRTQSAEILQHARQHSEDYKNKITHDHFGTLDHQLAAAAFNLLMEFYFSQGE